MFDLTNSGSTAHVSHEHTNTWIAIRLYIIKGSVECESECHYFRQKGYACGSGCEVPQIGMFTRTQHNLPSRDSKPRE